MRARETGGSEIATFNGGKKVFSPVLQVLRQCPLALLVKPDSIEDKALGREGLQY
jgi:hypothetical protein